MRSNMDRARNPNPYACPRCGEDRLVDQNELGCHCGICALSWDPERIKTELARERQGS